MEEPSKVGQDIQEYGDRPIRQDTTRTPKVDTPDDRRLRICPVNHRFCGHNHENGPGPVRSLGVAENANANEVASSIPSHYADKPAQQGVVTRDDYARIHFDRRSVDRRLCESEVTTPTGYHRICAVASPEGEEAVEMPSDCHPIRDGGNPTRIDEAGSTNDDTSAGRENHLMHPIRYRNRTKNPQRMSPRPMNCPKTTTRPLTLPDVVP